MLLSFERNYIRSWGGVEVDQVGSYLNKVGPDLNQVVPDLNQVVPDLNQVVTDLNQVVPYSYPYPIHVPYTRTI